MKIAIALLLAGCAAQTADAPIAAAPTKGHYSLTMDHVAGECLSTFAPVLPQTAELDGTTNTATILVGGIPASHYTISSSTWWDGVESCDWQTSWPEVSCSGTYARDVGGFGVNIPPPASLTVKITSSGRWADAISWQDEAFVYASCLDYGDGNCARAPYAGNLPCIAEVRRTWVLE